MADVKTGFGECKNCGKEIKLDYNVTNSYKKKRKFCNRKCMGIYNSKNKIYKNKFISSRIIRCDMCGKEFRVYNSEYKRNKHHFCNRKCWIKLKGQNHPNWKEGKIKSKHGIRKYTFDRRYVYEHRLVMEKKLRRFLKPNEVVHHLDYNNQNNDINNLYLFPNQSEHLKYHHFLQKCVKEALYVY